MLLDHPDQILPQIQDGGQKYNIGVKMHKNVFFWAKFVDFLQCEFVPVKSVIWFDFED